MNFSQKSLFTILGKFGGAFLSLLSSIFLARFLGVNGVGQYQLIISTQTIVMTIIAMGFGNASIYFINNKKIDKKIIASTILKFFSIIALVFAILVIIGLRLLPSYFGEIHIISIFIFAIGSASLLLFSLMLPLLYVSLEVVKIQFLSLLSTTILLIGLIFIYSANYFNVNVVLGISGVSSIVPFTLLLYFLKSSLDLKVKINFILIKEIFIYGVKLAATNLVFLLSSNLVIFLLKSLLDDGFEAVGLFSRATAIANMFVLIPASVGPLIYSKWSYTKINFLHYEVEKTLRILIFISLLAAVVIITFGEFILIFLYGIDFIEAMAPLNILSLSVIFSSCTIVLINVFSSIGKPTVTLKVFFLSLVITTIIAYIIIPNYNISGAAFSVLIGLIFNAIVLFYFAKKEINLDIWSSLILTKTDMLWIKDNLFKRQSII